MLVRSFLLLVVAILYMHYSWRREKNKLIQATEELLVSDKCSFYSDPS